MEKTDNLPFDLNRIGGKRALSELISEVVSAGNQALSYYRDGTTNNYQTKADHSPVTEADQIVENRLRIFLKNRFPDVGFLGEETGQSDASQSGMRFIVDPIDGTRAFIRGLRSWAVIVGLEAEAEPVLGVVYMPVSDDLYVAVKGGGAFGNGRSLRVSSIDSLDRALVVHGSLNQFTSTGLESLLIDLGNSSFSQRGFADFGGHRTVLHAKADAMIDPDTKPWDLCATAVLIREAGGVFTSLEGEHTIYGGGALLSNGLVHGELLKLIHRTRQDK